MPRCCLPPTGSSTTASGANRASHPSRSRSFVSRSELSPSSLAVVMTLVNRARYTGLVVAEEVTAFGRDVADRLTSALGDGLVGAYFVGSVALGGYVAGESDIDI